MANTTNPRRNAEGYSDPTAYEKPSRTLSVKKTKDFIDCCIHCFTCVSWPTSRSKVGLFWLINGTDGFGDERNESVHT